MDYYRRTRTIVIIVMTIAVLGLSIGFAVSSKELKITNGLVKVDTSDYNINVKLSSSYSSLATATIGPAASPADSYYRNQAGAIIDNSLLSIRNLKIRINSVKKAVKINYVFYALNQSRSEACLTDIIFSGPKYITCTAKKGTTQSQVDTLCSKIKINVSVSDEAGHAKSTSVTGTANPLPTGLSGLLLKPTSSSTNNKNYHTITVTLEYNGTSSSTVNGDFTANISDFRLNYQLTYDYTSSSGSCR